MSPFPLTEDLLCTYAAFLVDQQLSPQTIKSYLSALRNWQISLGLPDPREQSSMPMLKRVQACICRLRLTRGSPTRIRLPVTPRLLRQIKQALASSVNSAKLVIWAVAATAFFGFFRLGELLCSTPQDFNKSMCLSWGDVAINSHLAPTMVQIHLKKSKCDQFGAGAKVVIGATGDKLCPVMALLDYLGQREDRKGAFYLGPNTKPVLKPWFVKQIRSILSSLGVAHHQYTGHSFMIGVATTAALAGVEDSTIQALRRWHSAALRKTQQCYVCLILQLSLYLPPLPTNW